MLIDAAKFISQKIVLEREETIQNFSWAGARGEIAVMYINSRHILNAMVRNNGLNLEPILKIYLGALIYITSNGLSSFPLDNSESISHSYIIPLNGFRESVLSCHRGLR